MHSRIVADIGGTNARFAVAEGDRIQSVEIFPCRDHDSFEELLGHYLSVLAGDKIDRAAIAIATHVTSDTVKFTNLPWAFSIQSVAQQHGFSEFKVLNDFAATALAIPLLRQDQRIKVCGGSGDAGAARALLGAGTGLGMSGLLPNGNLWVPVEGEGGHIRLCPTNTYEKELFAVIQQGHQFVSAETVLSGRGLMSLHKAITQVEGYEYQKLLPEVIVARGLSAEDGVCAKVLSAFCGLLGSVAGDLALILGAQGGVYIGGGIINHIRDFFVKDSSFQEHFESKGPKTEYMRKIPVYMISDTNVGLLGARESTKLDYNGIGITWASESLRPNDNNNSLIK